MRNICLILLVILGLGTVSSQDILRTSVRIDGAEVTHVNEVGVFDDEILVVGWNFYKDSSQYFFCKLDSNLSMRHYVDLRTIDEDIVSGNTDIIKSNDGGFLISKRKANGLGDYMMIKFDNELKEEWHYSYYDSTYTSRGPEFLLEDASFYYVFGNLQYPDYTISIYCDKVSKQGELIEHKIIYESIAAANLDDVKIFDDNFYIGYNYSIEMSPTPLSRYMKIQEYDKDLTLLNEWGDRGDASNIHLNEDGIFFTSRYIWEPELPETIPRHIVRKLNSEFTESWTLDYLYPPFAFYEVGEQVFMYNVVHHMIPDPRGGYYVVGDVVGTAQQMDYMSWNHGFNMQGTSLIKIDEEGDMQWKYMDSFNYMIPKAIGQLSSGNLVLLGEGQVPDFENQTYRSRLTMIKTDADACEVPGCRISSSKDDFIEADINVYPNPSADGLFSISSNQELTASYQLTVTNQLGQEIHNTILRKNYHTIDLRSQSKGLYYYSIRSKENIIKTGKLVML